MLSLIIELKLVNISKPTINNMPNPYSKRTGYTNSKFKLAFALILLLGINSKLFAQIQPCGLHKNIISTNNIEDTLLASTDENLTFSSVDKGNTWKKYTHAFNETPHSSEKVSLGRMDISIDGKNNIAINETEFQLTKNGEEINSLFIHDSILYISTTNDLYKLPVMEFCKKMCWIL